MRGLLIVGLLMIMELSAAAASRHRHPRHVPMHFEATAFSTRGETAKGTLTHRGVVAADQALLPLGSVISVMDAGPYSGEYVVTDTGSKVVGRHIDVFMPSAAEAKEFGKKIVTVRLLVRGNNEKDHAEVTPAGTHNSAPQGSDKLAEK
jgi:3D (Asp-Asp-Asp) domain-containing protein